MSYTPPLDAEVTAFVTTALLASGATFDSGVLDADGKTQVQTEINASHDGTIDISFCADSGCTDVVRSLSIPYTAADGYQFFAAPAFVNYIKYEFTNTTAATQTDFYYTTKFLTTGLSPQLLTTDAFIAPAMVTELGRNIQVGTNPSGTFTNAKVDGVGFQTTDDLATGATFSSDVIDAQGYTQVQTHIVSDQDGTLGFKFCSTFDCSGTTVGVDGVERYLSVPYVADNGFQLYAAPAFTPYVQYTFENTGTGTTTQLFYETKLLTKALSGQLLGLDAFIAPAMVANLGRNIIAGVVGSTFKNVNVAETTNDAGTYHNLHVVSGARPSQLPGRTPVKIVLDISNTDTLVHTVAAGKTLYITDLNIFVENTANSSARINLVNSTGATTPIIYPIILADSGSQASANIVNGHTFTEPLEFDTGVYVDTVTGTNEIVGILNGYEE
jgi:hypothetical protein